MTYLGWCPHTHPIDVAAQPDNATHAFRTPTCTCCPHRIRPNVDNTCDAQELLYVSFVRHDAGECPPVRPSTSR
jgi:hypothetical protein